MKKLIFVISFLTLSFLGSAQIFTQATLNEILDEYKKDSKAYFNNRLSEDFRVINKEGSFQTRKDIVAAGPQKIVKTEIIQPVIFQSADLAVVSGIHQTTRIGSDGNQNTSAVTCTYTFQNRNNKWMFVASHQTSIAKK